MIKPLDLYDREIEVGDVIVFSTGWTTKNSFISSGVVRNIDFKDNTTLVSVEVTRGGRWYFNEYSITKNHDKGDTITFRYPMEHCKILCIK